MRRSVRWRGGFRGTLAAAAGPAGRPFRLLTPFGRVAAVAALLLAAAGLGFGWAELVLAAFTVAIVLVVALLWTIGTGPAHVRLDVDRDRVTVGERSTASVHAAAHANRRLRPLRVEVPMAGRPVAIDLPALDRGASVTRELRVPTDRRGVVVVGPVRATRGDALGLAERDVATGEARHVLVWPVTVRLPAFGADLRRDLEGRTTNDPSPSDVAFHALREYVTGDDRRHVHWRTSARVGQLMVREFVDTRRSQLALVLGTDPGEYTDEDEFELAVSVLGSLAVRALIDQQTSVVVAGGRLVPSADRRRLLDGLSVLPPGSPDTGLLRSAVAGRGLASAAGGVIFVVGARTPVNAVGAAATRWVGDASATVIRVTRGRTAARAALGTLTILEMGALSDLPRLMHAMGGR